MTDAKDLQHLVGQEWVDCTGAGCANPYHSHPYGANALGLSAPRSLREARAGAWYYSKLGLRRLTEEALRIATEHGFKDASPAEDIALMHSELSEALECLRAGALPHEALQGENGKPEGVPSEMADVVIRVLHFCGKHGIDLDAAVSEKMAFNEGRPFKHGKKL